MPAAIHEGLEDASNKVEDSGGSHAKKLDSPGRQKGASAAGMGNLGAAAGTLVLVGAVHYAEAGG